MSLKAYQIWAQYAHEQKADHFVLQWLVVFKSGVVPMLTIHMSMCMRSTAGRIYTSVLVDLGSSQDGLGQLHHLGCNFSSFLPKSHLVHSTIGGKVLAGPGDMATEGSAWTIALAMSALLVAVGL